MRVLRYILLAVGEGGDELVAIFRDADKDYCQNIELWIRGNGMLVSFNMKEVDVHGKIYADVEFDAFDWSHLTEKLFAVYYREEEECCFSVGKVGEAAKVR